MEAQEGEEESRRNSSSTSSEVQADEVRAWACLLLGSAAQAAPACTLWRDRPASMQ